MIKHLSLHKLLATLLTIVAVFAGQQAFATSTDFMSIRGQSANMNGQYYYVWSISGFMGQYPQPMTQGNSCTFNGQNIGLDRGDVHITGTLNFAESNELTDVTTGSQVTIVFSSDQFWFYDATVKKLDGTNVTGCSASASSDHTSITVTIPSGKTFGNIYLDFVAYEPFNTSNTTISGVEAEYIYTGRPIEPVPTVIYNGTTLNAGTHYTVSYSNSTGPGSASVTVTGTGQYAGTISRNYNIRAVALSDFTSLGNNTYAIATTTDLDHLAGYVKLGNECQGLTFKQTADITYTHTTDWNDAASTENNYTAIGNNSHHFKGNFDGQNHTVSGIRIYKGGTNNADGNQGLFGIANYGTVKRVHLADARITGKDNVGGIAGYTIQSTVEDCTVADNVDIHAVVNYSTNHGGIVGSNMGTVQRCISHATLSVAPNTIECNQYGGVAGYNYASVKDCLATGVTVPNVDNRGAIVGERDLCTLQRNYYRNCTVAGTANATGVGCNGIDIIALQGAMALYSLTLPENVTTNRTASATLPGTGNMTYTTGADIDDTPYYCQGGTVTLGYSGTVPAGQMPVYSVNGTAIEGNTFTMPTNDNTTVSVAFVNVWSGSGTQGSPYVITTTAQLDALANAVKGGESYSGTYFELGADIAYSTTGLGDTDENFTQIGGYFDGSDRNFSGTFDGKNHTISGIRLYKSGTSNADKNLGLFGRIDGATIRRVILSDARISGYKFIGGIVGNKVSGTVLECLVVESTITCANTYVGALFGKNNGTIAVNYYHNCSVNGTAVSVGVGGDGGVSASSDMNGARSVHTLTLQNGDITATGSTVAYQGTTWYASNTPVTLRSNNLLEGCVATYSLDGTTIEGNTFTMPAADATVNGSFVSYWHADADHDGTTEQRAYIITTTAGLDLLATKVNGGTNYYLKFFKLGANIAYDGTENNYTAIGKYNKPFSGTFDGDGYAVSGIHINGQGLFGEVEDGTIKNVTLRSSTITGKNDIGAIVGYLKNGTVTDCRVESTVTIGTSDDSSNNHGGIVGSLSGSATVNGCISAATVTDNGKTGCIGYGGIVGYTTINTTISNNIALGSNVGGYNYKGAIVGSLFSNNCLTYNYYHDCTVGGATINVGIYLGDVTTNDGAVYAVIRMVEGYGESTESDHWTFISSPLSSNTSATNVVNLINTTTPENYDFYKLVNTTWANYKTHEGNMDPGFNLENGHGYLYANKDDVALVFPGTYYSEATKEVLLQQGYNLVGNPFDGNATIDRNYYTMNTDGTGIVATAVNGSTPIAPCTGVIVQATGTSETVTFTKVTTQQNPTNNQGNLQITLSQVVERAEVPEPVEGPKGGGVSTSSTTATLDNAIITFNEGSQLGKFYFGEQDGNIYIPQGGEEYAIAFSNGYGEMPVNFKAAKNGEYTLSFSTEGVTFEYLHLIDNLTGADVDLLVHSVPEPVEGPNASLTGPSTSSGTSYTFTAKTTDYESRFKLVFCTNGDGPSTGSGTFAFINNGNIIVNGEGTLQVVDVMGRILVSGDAKHCVSTRGFVPGVYVLRLINGNDVKVQKVVIR